MLLLPPQAAAHDADLLLYKLRGPQAPTNFPLSSETKGWLDSISLSDLMAWFRQVQLQDLNT
jgi:hypothetical protein